MSLRKRFSPPSARSTASIADVRSGPGSTASSSASVEPPDRAAGDTLAALARLSPEHRAVIVMRYLLEMTPGEIAEALELPRGTVNSRLRRGLDALGQTL
jgi:RNA polymerase sigma-70 factor (ECF subfamily)